MDAEKKRKRGEISEVDGEGGRRKMEREVMNGEKAEAAAPAPTPTEEEVDEFFAILRRMHVAVKYFERSNGNGNSNSDGRKLTGCWSTALEAEVLGGVEDVEAGEKRVEAKGVLDLNVVPEAETILAFVRVSKQASSK
ncbi:hypothetical protein F0562_023802 [Nyssa sinensis]|uniref:Protein NIM1-INTERACTING 2 n=1 Tax=Nyssa sinensis TaxID=561372 RepID=A0A5J5BIV1_9ASTE|nr:hypothetical protein F0562_023802 [Nyssa sinensis]